MRTRSILWPLMIGAVLLFVVGVCIDAIPLLRGPAEWRWGLHVLTRPGWRLLLPLIFLGLYALAAARWITAFPIDSAQPAKRIERSFLIFLTVAAPVIQFVLASAVWNVPLFEFFADTTSPSVTGFYSVAVTTPDLPAHFSTYTEFMLTLPIHPQTHPPGLVMLHWLVWQGFAAAPELARSVAMPLRTLQCQNTALMTLNNAQLASSIFGMIVPILGGLIVWPLYALGRRLIGARQAALAAAIFPILPMFVMWPSQWDQVYPLLLVTGLYFTHTGLEGRTVWRFALAGLVFSCATFLSVGNLIMVAIAVVYVIVWWCVQASWRQLFSREMVWRWAGELVLLAAGCLSIWLIYIVAFHVPLADLLTVGKRLLLENTRCPMCPSTHRTYGVWMIWDVVDFAFFLSLPIVMLLLVRLPAMLKKSYRAIRWKEPTVWVPLLLAAVSVFMALDLAGISRGEVSRIWAYFGPLFLLLALAPVKTIWPLKRAGLVVLIGLIGLQVYAMYTRWDTYPSFMNEPPARTADFATPDPRIEANVDFGRHIRLVGADVDRTTARINLDLYWEALRQPHHAYTVFVHVLDAQGNLIAQQDNMPVHDQLPTSCWRPSEEIADPYTINLPADGPRPASIEIGLYRLDTGQRLTRRDGAGTTWTIPLAS